LAKALQAAVLLVFTQPLAGLHESFVQTLLSSQLGGGPPTQLPLEHLSAVVQALLSLQKVPSAIAGFEHWPFDGLQVPATWHWSEALQTTGLAPVQVPPWQVSLCVHALPSLQPVPSEAAGFEHWPFAELQVPATWHWSEAVQTTGLAPVQVPPWQVSLWVHALPSLQPVPLAATGFEH
jgi:hypothetical protein